MSNPLTGGKDNPLWKEADDIYQRWKNEEFDIDGQKAFVEYAHTHSMTDKKGKLKNVSKEESFFSDMFSNAFMEWPVKKLFPSIWIQPARDLIAVYTHARSMGWLVPGSAVKKELQEREHRIVQLDSDLKTMKDTLADYERRLRDCGDRMNGLEVENQKLRERNPVFGVAQSTVDEVAEDATKEEDKE